MTSCELVHNNVLSLFVLFDRRKHVSKRTAGWFVDGILRNASPANTSHRVFLPALQTASAEYTESNCADNRVAIVHLFEWKWSDVAAECERFLAPMGYCGVQVRRCRAVYPSHWHLPRTSQIKISAKLIAEFN